jgi:aerobic-type carbon monoxide dehydrogenase small subunit (CoxS/CutS family)
MSDLRREIEKIITAYCSFCATGQCFGHEKVATALAALFEKRIEPLRKVYEKWTRTNGCNCETCVAVRSVVEGREK